MEHANAPRGVAARIAGAVPVIPAACLLAGILGSSAATAQDALLDALMLNRQLVRTAEVISEIGPKAEVYGPVSIVASREASRRLVPDMPTLTLPVVATPALVPRPEPVRAAPESRVVDLTAIRWKRVAAEDEERFMGRFAEVLWTNASRSRTPIDTLSTSEVRARLNAVFGAPTRSPVARARPELQSGSEFVQFEYWFVVNDEIPFVVMDRDGPFGQGVLLLADEGHLDVLEVLEQDLAARLLAHDRLMPYVDYYQSRDDGQWYRTGFDGEQFYILETERPRWARRGQQRGRWYDFR